MIKTLLCLICILSFSTTAKAEDREVELKLLQQIDDTCSDAWCEGQQAFHFNDLRIINNKAILFYEIADTTKVETDEDFNNLIYTEATCTLTLDEDNTTELSYKAFDELTECFGNPKYNYPPETVPNPFLK